MLKELGLDLAMRQIAKYDPTSRARQQAAAAKADDGQRRERSLNLG